MSLQTRITALVQAIGADIKALYSGKVGTSDPRLTDAREWTASTVTQAEAEAGIATTRRAWTAQRVFQAIAAWWAASAMKTKLDGIATGATANATDAQLRDRATHTGTQAISTVSGLQTALDGKINTTERGVSGGIPTLDEFARIPASQLPSYVDDVLEYLTAAEFPATGETGKIYIAINQGTAANPTRQYRWTGSVYAEINPSPGTTDALAEGSTNLYFSASRVRNTVLTGLSLASSATVAATDTVLAAFGKIQAQLGLKANIESPTLTGVPRAPSPAASDADTKIATMGSVRAAMGLFGLGASPVTTGADLNTAFTATTFFLTNALTQNVPIGAGTGIGQGYGLHIQHANSNYAYQKWTQLVSTRTFERLRLNGPWSDWVEVWNSSNLVKQTSATDTTPGALMAVGAFGLGAGTSSLLESGSNWFGSRVRGWVYTAPNGPASATDSMGLDLGYDATRRFQAAITRNNEFKFRYSTDPANDGAWRTIWNDGNFNPATKQDKSTLVATATSRTLALTDAWNYVRPGTTSAITLTVPTNASVAFEIGTEITIRASGNITIAAAGGVTLNAPSGGTLSMTARMTVTLKKVGANEWDVIGQTVAA